MRRPVPRSAFTLVELLVTVAVIGILLGVLVPSLGTVMANARATRSMSNLRQWGAGMQAWGNANNERIPWEGAKGMPDGLSPASNANVAFSLQNSNFWPNAVGPILGMQPYSEMVEEAFREQRNISVWDNRDTVWNDPAAQSDRDRPWEFGEVGKQGFLRQFWFSYAMNIRLNNTWLTDGNFPEFTNDRLVGWANIPHADRTVLMLELRARPDELPQDDPHYARNLNRAQCSWKRFAARHQGGGHILFVDGHVAWALNREVTTNAQGRRDPATPNGDWNTSKYIFDPTGPARN